MPENLTLVLVGVGIAFLLALFFYYLNRQMERLKSDLYAVNNHVMFQQKVLERHDQVLSQQLDVPPILPVSQSRSAMNVQPQVPSSQPQLSPQPTQTASQVIDFASAVPIAPMVGSLLNIFSQMQSSGDDNDTEYSNGHIEEVSISHDDIDQELSEELEELNKDTKPSKQVASTSTPSTSPSKKGSALPMAPVKKEGRIDLVEVEPIPVGTVAVDA